MKTKLFKFYYIHFLIVNPSSAIEYKTSSKHWSLTKNGPTTNEEAIECFCRIDIQIHMKESGWRELGAKLIVKDGPSKYKKYVIDVEYSDLNGTHETTYYKTAKKGQLSFYTRIVWKNGRSYRYATSTGDLYWKNINTLQREIHRHATNPYAEFTRVWPLDYYKHNAKYLEKKTNQKKRKKGL